MRKSIINREGVMTLAFLTRDKRARIFRVFVPGSTCVGYSLRMKSQNLRRDSDFFSSILVQNSRFLGKMLIALAIFTTLPIEGKTAKQIVVESHIGETYVFQVEPHDSFLEVMDAIQSCLDDKDGSEERYQEFRIHMNADLIKMAKKVRALPRNYEGGVSPVESADIFYIVKTLSSSSLPKIKSAESSLKKAGDRIDHVHPFHFLSCVFNNEELKVCLRNLQGRSWVWKDFLSGVVEALTEENARNNVLPYVQDFAANIGVDIKVILPLVQAGRWEKFINTLIEVIPRQGGNDRYNM